MSERKIYDYKRIMEQYCENICDNCEHYWSGYYDGHPEPPECHGNAPQDCDEAIQEFIEEMGEDYDMEKSTNMNLTVDLVSLKNEIVGELKRELLVSIKTDLETKIVNKVYDEVAAPQIEKIGEKVKDTVNELVKAEVMKFYNETKISIGGGFYEEPEEYTIAEYTKKTLQETIQEGTIRIPTGDRYNKFEEVSFSDYISKKAVTSEVKTYMDNELKQIQKNVDKNVKEVFNTKIQTVMSEVALGVLKSNATYNEAMKKLTGE